MRWVSAACCLLALASSPGVRAEVGAAPRIYLEPSPLSGEVKPLLDEELPGVVFVAAPGEAELSLSLLEEDGAIAARLMADDGRLLLERSFEAHHGRTAALRRAVLAVERALAAEAAERAEAERAPAPLAVAAERPPPWGRALGVRAGGSLLVAASAAQLGVDLDVFFSFERLRAGVTASVAGLGCCVATSDGEGGPALEAELGALALLAQGEAHLFSLGPLDVAGFGALGAERLGMRVVPRAFRGSPVASEAVQWSVAGRLGLALEGPLAGPLGWRLQAGAALRSQALAVALPAEFPVAGEPVRAGSVSPFAGLSVGSTFF